MAANSMTSVHVTVDDTALWGLTAVFQGVPGQWEEALPGDAGGAFSLQQILCIRWALCRSLEVTPRQVRHVGISVGRAHGAVDQCALLRAPVPHVPGSLGNMGVSVCVCVHAHVMGLGGSCGGWCVAP